MTEITIKRDDFDELNHIFDGISEIEFIYKNRFRENRSPLKIIRVCSKSFSSFLRENDYNEKSYKSPEKILSLIPNDKKVYFFRGLVDGDGCFYIKNRIRQFTVTSSINQDWNYMEILFSKLEIDKYSIKRISKTNSYSQIRICNIHDIKKLCDYLYHDIEDNIFLKRKYDKYQLMLESSDLSKKRNTYNINLEELILLKKRGYSVKELSEHFKCPQRSIYRRL